MIFGRYEIETVVFYVKFPAKAHLEKMDFKHMSCEIQHVLKTQQVNRLNMSN